MMRRDIMTRVGSVAISVLTVIVGILLTLALISVLSTSPGHDEIANKQIVIEEQLRFVSCLLMVPPDDRTPEVIANCQAPVEPTP